MKMPFKKRKSFLSSASFFHRIGKDPYLDWQIIILITLVAGGGLIGFGYYEFQKVVTDMKTVLLSESPTGVRSLLDMQSLNTVTANFDRRQIEVGQLSGGYNGVRDPSQ